MSSALHTEFSALVSAKKKELDALLTISGRDARLDAIVLFCRGIVRSSSLCYVEGKMYYNAGRMYRPCTLDYAFEALGNVLIDNGAPPTDIRRMYDMPFLVVSERSFSKQPYIAFRNGVLDIESLSFSSEVMKDRVVTEGMDYYYNPQASCDKWEKFLKEVLPDETVRLKLQEFFGMVYLDRSAFSIEKFAIFIGRGANGKSVIFEVMKRALGEENVTTLDSSQLEDEKMLPYVKGARLNFAPDMASYKDFSSALKALASGQDVTARRIYGDAEKIKCPPLCFAMNELPRFRDVTDAFFRRLLLFTFDVQIPPHRQDKRLVDHICETDLPGIFNWILQGRFRLMRNAGEFTYCEKMEKEILRLRQKTGNQGANPARSYLERHGLSVYPSYEGQKPVLVTRREIYDGLGGTVSYHAITRELTGFGVIISRNRELSYKVYEKTTK